MTKTEQSNIRVLAIDSEESPLDLLEAIMNSIGVEVERTSDGDIALEKYRQGKFHIVFTDLMHSGLSGYGLLKAIREIDQNQVVVFISGWQVIGEKIKELDVKPNAFLIKPYKMVDLVNLTCQFFPQLKNNYPKFKSNSKTV